MPAGADYRLKYMCLHLFFERLNSKAKLPAGGYLLPRTVRNPGRRERLPRNYRSGQFPDFRTGSN